MSSRAAVRLGEVVELRHGDVVGQPALAEVPGLLAAGAEVAAPDLRRVVLGLRVAEGERRGLFGLGEDVRDAVGVAADRGLRRRVGRRPAVRESCGRSRCRGVTRLTTRTERDATRPIAMARQCSARAERYSARSADDRVDPRRAPGRHVTRRHGNQRERDRGGDERRRIVRAGVEQQLATSHSVSRKAATTPIARRPLSSSVPRGRSGRAPCAGARRAPCGSRSRGCAAPPRTTVRRRSRSPPAPARRRRTRQQRHVEPRLRDRSRDHLLERTGRSPTGRLPSSEYTARRAGSATARRRHRGLHHDRTCPASATAAYGR